MHKALMAKKNHKKINSPTVVLATPRKYEQAN